MLMKTITYKDFNDNERTETFYFNLTQAEVTEWEVSHKGGLSELIKLIMSEQDIPKLMDIFKQIIARSYGKKSADGRLFEKLDIDGHRLVSEFMATNAYSQLYMELATNAQAALDFVHGAIPDMPKPADPKTGLKLET